MFDSLFLNWFFKNPKFGCSISWNPSFDSDEFNHSNLVFEYFMQINGISRQVYGQNILGFLAANRRFKPIPLNRLDLIDAAMVSLEWITPRAQVKYKTLNCFHLCFASLTSLVECFCRYEWENWKRRRRAEQLGMRMRMQKFEEWKAFCKTHDYIVCSCKVRPQEGSKHWGNGNLFSLLFLIFGDWGLLLWFVDSGGWALFTVGWWMFGDCWWICCLILN